MTMLAHLPQRIQEIVKDFKEKVAKEREIFLKVYSTYPLFTEEEVSTPTIALMSMGISNQNYPPRAEGPMHDSSEENINQLFLNNYVGIISTVQGLTAHTRINYKSS